MERQMRETLSDVSHEGQNVRARRERLGMTGTALAAEAGVNRNTLAALEAGDSFNRTTLAKLERALTRLEDEAGLHAPLAPDEESKFVEFVVEGDFGVRVVVKGPIADRAEIEASAIRLMRELRAERGAAGETPESGAQ